MPGIAPATAAAITETSPRQIDYAQLCRETEHVPLVHAAIDPVFINVWSESQSRHAGRYEQYTFRTKRIDVRENHEISLYHGLIHRTLDLIGESRWKYRDARPSEDYEHWLIYHTLETHWPGAQRRQGDEPSRAALRKAAAYWTENAAAYAAIEAKAVALDAQSWCARQTLPSNAVVQLAPPAVTSSAYAFR